MRPQLPEEEDQDPFLPPRRAKPPAFQNPHNGLTEENSQSPRLSHQSPLSPYIKTKPPPSPDRSYTYVDALKTLALNTIPLIIVYFALFTVRNLSLHFSKKTNDNELTNAIGIGNASLNVVGLAVFMSLNAGLISQASRAFGAKNHQLVGLYMHRALFINAICLIPGSLLLFWADKLCVSIGINPELAMKVQHLTAGCIFGIYAMMVYHTLSSYLYACDIFIPSSITLITSSIIFAVLSYLLWSYTSLNITAVVISFNVMQATNALMIFCYIKFMDPVPGSFFWFKSQSFKGIWTLFVHEFHVGSMVFLEWIAYEIIYLFAGQLNLIQLGAVTIVFTNFQTLYAVPISLADTVK